MLEIQPKARIVGEVYYKVLEMHSGALVQGKLSRHESADPCCTWPCLKCDPEQQWLLRRGLAERDLRQQSIMS
jgi:cytoskeletal protein CcmA (bactofilin family)